MPALSLGRRTRIGLTIASTAGFLRLLCWLPYQIPFPKVYSVSYIFGYNNRVAMLLTGCWIVLVALLAPASENF